MFVPSQILHLIGVFECFWGIIWFGCCLNRSVTLRRWSNDIRKNRNEKILKYSIPHILRTLPILHFFGLFKIFWGIIWLGCCLNRFITLRRWSNDIRKNRNAKILKNSQGYEQCEDSSNSSFPPNSPLLWTC